MLKGPISGWFYTGSLSCNGPGSRLSSQECLLLLQKTRGWFSAPVLGDSQPSVTPAPGNPKPLWVPAITGTSSHQDTQTQIINLVKSSTKVMSHLEVSIPCHPPLRLFQSSCLFCDILWALLGNVQAFCLWLGMQWLFIINILRAYGSLHSPLTMTKDFSEQSWYQLTYGHTQLFRVQISRDTKSIRQ